MTKEVVNIFTGLVEEIGRVIEITQRSDGIKLKIECSKVIKDGRLGDSIATNGTCLTVTEIGNNYFKADVMNESVKRTNLKYLKIGDKVNLEKSITLTTFLGGHLVTGDIDGEGIIKNINSDGFAELYEIEIEARLMKYIVEKGRVTIDGASLTIVDYTEKSFRVSLIPHTQNAITLGSKKAGNVVNVETDLIGKYVERMLDFNENQKKSEKNIGKLLMENGFM